MSNINPRTNGEWRAVKKIPNCEVVFDVGARTDADFVEIHPDAEYHLFEPIPKFFECLKEKLENRPNVHLNRVALGNKKEDSSLFLNTQSIFRRTHDCQSFGEKVPIKIICLDDYCEEMKISKIDFIKIDTEGYELAVLKGGINTIHQKTRVVQFEYGGCYKDADITLRQVMNFFGEGWIYYKIMPHRLIEINRYSPSLEDYIYANYFASREKLRSGWFGF